MTTGRFSRIFLTGLSGSGKSTVARLVAEALGWQAVDTDALIEEAEGRSIAEIFASGGEEQFRALERQQIADAAAPDNVVVATGGGAILDIGIRQSMASGLVVCLPGSP
ncbi:MAG: shikimate kinase, partial [Chloroflexi bacterium]|nr:shikimate kinase [Chloroflexota bacterium]